MLDKQNRLIDYLRISVTDRCNLRCHYCMPKQGVNLVDHAQILRYEELLRLARLFSSLGIRRIRLTGGEPLVREGLPTLVAGLKNTHGIRAVYLTTNGILLSEQLPALLDAGLDGVNVSLDTLNRSQYAAITQRDQLDRALDGLYAAMSVPGLRVKINCVPTHLNADQWTALAELARENGGLDVRFIELMPLGLGNTVPRQTEGAVLAVLEKQFGPSSSCPGELGGGPSRYVTFSGFQGRIGFISAMTHPFCCQCNRVRLTATGQLKPCLYYDTGTDLRKLLREGEDDDALRNAIAEAVQAKPASHQFGSPPFAGSEGRYMNQIGG